MRRETELALIDELLGLKASKAHFLDDEITFSPVERYGSAERFEEERKKIFLQEPQLVAHSSELPEPNAFVRRTIAGLPVLLTRDDAGIAHAFLNVCRHRGAELVAEDQGCKKRFVCPYHAWTYDTQGRLLTGPYMETGFPNFDKKSHGLKKLGCAEEYGFIWVNPGTEETPDPKATLGSMAEDIKALNMQNLEIFADYDEVWDANWKIFLEGGIEAYHFRIAHKDTVAPYFEDNLSSYQVFGNHIRSVLPRRTISSLHDQPRESWRIRDHANVLYTIFPSTQFLVQSDHVVWVKETPINYRQTRIQLITLAPKSDGERSEADLAHWIRNHKITMTTLGEDFEIGIGIQRGIESGANTHLTFARYEGALNKFNLIVENALK